MVQKRTAEGKPEDDDEEEYAIQDVGEMVWETCIATRDGTDFYINIYLFQGAYYGLDDNGEEGPYSTLDEALAAYTLTGADAGEITDYEERFL